MDTQISPMRARAADGTYVATNVVGDGPGAITRHRKIARAAETKVDTSMYDKARTLIDQNPGHHIVVVGQEREAVEDARGWLLASGQGVLISHRKSGRRVHEPLAGDVHSHSPPTCPSRSMGVLPRDHACMP